MGSKSLSPPSQAALLMGLLVVVMFFAGPSCNESIPVATSTPSAQPSVQGARATPDSMVLSGSIRSDIPPGSNPTLVEAFIEGRVVASSRANPGYRLVITQPEAENYLGKLVEFRVDGLLTGQAVGFHKDWAYELNLVHPKTVARFDPISEPSAATSSKALELRFSSLSVVLLFTVLLLISLSILLWNMWRPSTRTWRFRNGLRRRHQGNAGRGGREGKAQHSEHDSANLQDRLQGAGQKIAVVEEGIRGLEKAYTNLRHEKENQLDKEIATLRTEGKRKLAGELDALQAEGKGGLDMELDAIRIQRTAQLDRHLTELRAEEARLEARVAALITWLPEGHDAAVQPEHLRARTTTLREALIQCSREDPMAVFHLPDSLSQGLWREESLGVFRYEERLWMRIAEALANPWVVEYIAQKEECPDKLVTANGIGADVTAWNTFVQVRQRFESQYLAERGLNRYYLAPFLYAATTTLYLELSRRRLQILVENSNNPRSSLPSGDDDGPGLRGVFNIMLDRHLARFADRIADGRYLKDDLPYDGIKGSIPLETVNILVSQATNELITPQGVGNLETAEREVSEIRTLLGDRLNGGSGLGALYHENCRAERPSIRPVESLAWLLVALPLARYMKSLFVKAVEDRGV